MSQEVIKLLENRIAQLKEESNEYLETHSVDSYVMSVAGKIDGMRLAIYMLQKEGK